MKKTLMVLFLLFFSILSVSAQVISGKVINKNTKEPIVNAFIKVVDADVTTTTNNKGEFSLIADSKQKLKISHLSFISQVVPVGEANTIKMVLRSINLNEIVVETHENISHTTIVAEELLKGTQPRNVADLFQKVNGFNLSKRSNYSIDPVFRSLKYEQLNVQYDGGMKVVNACPNRMDPITTHVIPEEIEKIEVIRGPFSVRYGSNFGGVVNLKTRSSFRNIGHDFHGNVSTGYELNGNSYMGMASLGYVKDKYDFTVNGGIRDYGNYKDGEGVEVPSSFKSYDYSVNFGLKPNQNQILQLQWRQSFAMDVLHPGLPMDSPEDKSSIAVVDYKIQNISDKLYSISFKGFYSYVDHLMSNDNRQNFKVVESQTPVQSRTLGGKMELTLIPTKSLNLYTGLDLNNINRTGYRNRLVKIKVTPDTSIVLGTPKEFLDSIWQNSTLIDIGAFLESHYRLGEIININAGIRFDFVNAKVEEPAAEFSREYDDFENLNEVNTSAFLSVQYNLSKRTNLELALGKGVRTASETERYINHLSVGTDPYEMFGNPLLKPEINNQIELSVDHKFNKVNIGANVYYSIINNYITSVVDSTLERKFIPWQMPQNARRFQNVDKATQKGFEVYAQAKLPSGFTVKGVVSYTNAQNEDFDEPLPLIPPMQSLISLKYESNLFWVDLQSRIVSKQDRFATSFGETETPGHITFDFKAGVNPYKGVMIGFSVLNITNEAYYDHLSWKYKNQVDGSLTGKFYEQGRNITAYMKYAF